jgi:hypothetical protein
MKQKRNLLVVIVILIFLVFACQMEASRPDSTPEPIYIDGTPYTNPMDIIEQFAKQTAVAQTETANRYYSSPVYATQMPDTTEILFVDLSDGRRAAFSLAELSGLPEKTIVAAGRELTGISLTTILEASGLGAGDSIQTVSVSGFGSVTLLKSKIDDSFIFLVTGGSLKLVSPSLPQSAWLDGVALITLR